MGSLKAPKGRPSVGDLFCGAGGFSEGLIQAGFQVKWAVDNWAPARETYKKNHPSVDVRTEDILDLDPAALEPVDVIVGSPPCVHFSAANRPRKNGGGGNHEEGLVLVRRFLSFVKALRPQYWVMENVPNLLPLLEDRMRGTGEFPLEPGSIPIPNRAILDAADYGVPQHRRRMFSGKFPLPEPSHGPGRARYVTLRDVIAALPDPTIAPPNGSRQIEDPSYPGLRVGMSSLRDHFEDRRWRLNRYDRERAQEQKTEHPWLGKMVWPDDLDRPCRTITATRTPGSRSTIVIPFNKKNRRTLTAREAASVQGFPIGYQFWADTMGNKDILAGNAVPPPVACAIGGAIRLAMGLPRVRSPRVEFSREVPEPLAVRFRIGHRFSPRRHFHRVVPIDERKDHRVELDNEFSRNALPPASLTSRPDWKTRVYLGYAKQYAYYEVRWRDARALASRVLNDSTIGVSPRAMGALLESVAEYALHDFPDAVSLQERWAGRRRIGRNPLELCEEVARLVNHVLPVKIWANRFLPVSLTEPVLQPIQISRGEHAGDHQPVPMSVRLLAAAVSTSLICQRLNEGSVIPADLLAAVRGGVGELIDYVGSSTQPK